LARCPAEPSSDVCGTGGRAVYGLISDTTWGRRSQAGAVAGAIVLILGSIIGFLNIDAKAISAQIHSAVGTERQVAEALDEISLSEATQENPIFRLIGRTMRQAPVLAFHGEQTFSRSFEMELPNRECQERRREEVESLSSDEFEGLPLPHGAVALEDVDVEDLCAIRGLIDFGLDLDIPFHARFFKSKSGMPPHQIWLIAFIRRTSADDDSTLGDEADAEGRPPGFCFLYKPASPAAGIESLAIANLERTGNGFWIVNLTRSLIEAGVWKEPPANPDATTSLHSIVIEGVMAARDESAPNTECANVTRVDGQIISVSAMILVNKNAHE